MSKRMHSESSMFGAMEDTASRGSTSDPDRQPVYGKRLLSCSEQISFTRVRSIDELDKRALQLQNKKLWEGFTERKAVIVELRERIEHLENRQLKDDALLCVINRYWNQVSFI